MAITGRHDAVGSIADDGMTKLYGERSEQPRGGATRLVAGVVASVLLTVIAIFLTRGGPVRGAGPLVVVEDVSSSGAGYFSGSVCFQVIRDGDGTVISDNCVDAPATFAAPDGLETGVPYSISISLSDPNCALMDDSRVGDGSTPFVIRVSCDAAFMTATAAAQPTSTPTPLPTDTPVPTPSPTPSPTRTPPSPTPTPSPASTPTPRPTSAPEPTPGVSPTGQPETATPLPTETPTIEPVADSPTETAPAELISPQVLDVELSQLDGTGGEQRVRGTIRVSYRIASSPGATTSVLFAIGNLDANGEVIVPGDVTLVSLSDPSPVGAGEPACAPFDEASLPVSLESAVPIVTCTEQGSGEYQQDITFEFPTTSAATIDDYNGSVSLTMAIAP